MNVTIATDNRAPFVLPLSADTDIGTLRMVLEADTGIPSLQQRILFNGADIQRDVAATLGSLGVGEAALLYVTRLPQHQQRQQHHQQPQPQPQQQPQLQPAAVAAEPLSPHNYIGMTFEDVPPNCDPRVLREIIRVNPPMMRELEHGNPPLAEAAAHADPQRFVDVLNRQAQEKARRRAQQQAELNALYGSEKWWPGFWHRWVLVLVGCIHVSVLRSRHFTHDNRSAVAVC
jgi:DNA damage-inducible protein 1